MHSIARVNNTYFTNKRPYHAISTVAPTQDQNSDVRVVPHAHSESSGEEDLIHGTFHMHHNHDRDQEDMPGAIQSLTHNFDKQGKASSLDGNQAASERSCPAETSRPPNLKILPGFKKPTIASIDDSDVDDFTPASVPNRRRSVLVAKSLTNSDASSGRIILPRVAVEANLPFVTAYRHYALAVRDSSGRRYEFVVKSWANGTEHRRVFVLEQAAEYLRSHGVGVGDAIGICTDENGELVVECNTPEVRQATVCPKYGALALSAPPPGSSNGHLPLAASGRCIRSGHCTKPAGHPGFCSGPKAAAVAVTKPRRRALELAVAAAAMDNSAASEGHTFYNHHSTEGEYSSDETAATTIATPIHANLPSGLFPIAHIPAGVRMTKVLTAYDISSQRIVMPAEEVDHGVLNARRVDTLTLAAVDESQAWQFPTLRAWTSITGRRGYILDDAAKFLASRGARTGDIVVIYRENDTTPPRVDLRVGRQLPDGSGYQALDVRYPSAPDASCLTFAELPLLMQPKVQLQRGSRGSNAGTPRYYSSAGTHQHHHHHAAAMQHMLSSHHHHSHQQQHGTTTTAHAGAMVCNRTSGCTKSAGHQGFCSGHKGFKKREGGCGTPTAGGGGGFGNHRHAFRLRTGKGGLYEDEEDDGDYEWAGSEDEEDYMPMYKRAKKGVSTPRADDPLVSLLSLLDG